MSEKIVSYLSMGVALALVVQKPDVIARAINAFAGGVSGIVGGIVGSR